MGGSGRALAGLLACGMMLLAVAPKDNDPKLLLHAAVGAKDVEKVKEVLESGVDVETLDNNREPALMHAAWDGSGEIVQLLMEHNANPNPQDRGKDYPLVFAAFQGHLPIIEALCSSPIINPNLQNKAGFTALGIAIVRR